MRVVHRATRAELDRNAIPNWRGRGSIPAGREPRRPVVSRREIGFGDASASGAEQCPDRDDPRTLGWLSLATARTTAGDPARALAHRTAQADHTAFLRRGNP